MVRKSLWSQHYVRLLGSGLPAGNIFLLCICTLREPLICACADELSFLLRLRTWCELSSGHCTPDVSFLLVNAHLMWAFYWSLRTWCELSTGHCAVDLSCLLHMRTYCELSTYYCAPDVSLPAGHLADHVARRVGGFPGVARAGLYSIQHVIVTKNLFCWFTGHKLLQWSFWRCKSWFLLLF